MESQNNKSKIKQDLVNKEHIISNIPHVEKPDKREYFSTQKNTENLEIVDSDSEPENFANLAEEVMGNTGRRGSND